MASRLEELDLILHLFILNPDQGRRKVCGTREQQEQKSTDYRRLINSAEN